MALRIPLLSSAAERLRRDRISSAWVFLLLRGVQSGRGIEGEQARCLRRDLELLGPAARDQALRTRLWSLLVEEKSDSLPKEMLITPPMALCMSADPDFLSEMARLVPAPLWLDRVEASRCAFLPASILELPSRGASPSFRSVGPLALLCAMAKPRPETAEACFSAAADLLPGPVSPLEALACRNLARGTPLALRLEAHFESRALESAAAAPARIPSARRGL